MNLLTIPLRPPEPQPKCPSCHSTDHEKAVRFPANPYRRPNDRLECGVCCADADHLDEDEKESEKDWARDAERKYYERR